MTIKVTKQEILEFSCLLQVCTEHKSGSESAVHAMNSLFLHEEADAVLLVDASNTFNTINRAAALHNIRVLYPATFAINTKEVLHVCMYALSI